MTEFIVNCLNGRWFVQANMTVFRTPCTICGNKAYKVFQKFEDAHKMKDIQGSSIYILDFGKPKYCPLCVKILADGVEDD